MSNRACFQLFCEAVPSISLQRFNELCDAAWQENPNLALALFVWLGTFSEEPADGSERFGTESKNFYRAMIWLYTKQPDTLKVNLERIAAHTSAASLVNLLEFTNQTGTNSLETSDGASSGNDWRSTATSERLEQEFDLFAALETFKQLEVSELEPIGNSNRTLYDEVAEVFARGLQNEQARDQGKDKQLFWYKESFQFALSAPIQGEERDAELDLASGIIARLFGGEAGAEHSARYHAMIKELRAAEAKRGVIGAKEKQFKEALLRVMGAPVKEQRQLSMQALILKHAIREANKREQLPETVRCAFTPGSGKTIGRRKLQMWKADLIALDKDVEDEWDDWEDRLTSGKRGGGKRVSAAQQKAKQKALRRLLLDRDGKVPAREKLDSEIQQAVQTAGNSVQADGNGVQSAVGAGAGEQWEREAQMRRWRRAVEEECARVEADEEALREVAEERMAGWLREAERELERELEKAEGMKAVEEAEEEIEREVEEAMKGEWVRELERQYAEVEAEAEVFLAMAEQAGEGAGVRIAGAGAGVQGEWVEEVRRQWSGLLLQEMEDEEEENGAYGKMAAAMVREASAYLADDEGEAGGADEGEEGGECDHDGRGEDARAEHGGGGEGRGRVWVELPVGLLLAQSQGS